MASSLSSLDNNRFEGIHREVNVSTNKIMKNVKLVESNISVAALFLNIQTLKMI